MSDVTLEPDHCERKYAEMSKPLVALVTAGSAGLGAATAKAFATAGYRVIINYSNNSSRASSLLAELQDLSQLPQSTATEPDRNFLSIKADLSKKPEIEYLVSEAAAAWGRLDVVFSNGGWTAITEFDDLDDNVDEEMWDRCWNMNVKSHLWMIHAARKHLDETDGCFITTASLAGIRPSGSSVVCLSSFHFFA